MVLKLTIEIPDSADPNTTLGNLLGAALNEHGITLVTPQGWHADVVLSNVEDMQEVLL